MTLVVAVILIVGFVVLVAGAVLVRSRRADVLEAPFEAPAETPVLVEQPEVVLPPELVDAPPVEEAAVDAPAVEAPPVEAPAVRPRLRDRLGRARALFAEYADAVRSRSSIDDQTWEDLEEMLIRADVGVATSAAVLDSLRRRVKADSISTPDALITALEQQLEEDLSAGDRMLRIDAGVPNVWLVVGVNGVGKTTTIGKLGLRESSAGRQVLMAAGDTFRAAAVEQLATWAERVGADIVRGGDGADPGAVVFDAVQRAAARGAELVLADTAGRLHTRVNLMEELRKVRRVAEREPGHLSEVLLV